jgi:hypothetical protein
MRSLRTTRQDKGYMFDGFPSIGFGWFTVSVSTIFRRHTSSQSSMVVTWDRKTVTDCNVSWVRNIAMLRKCISEKLEETTES